jgi:hypothetical protein
MYLWFFILLTIVVEWELFNMNKARPTVHSLTEACSVLLLYTYTQSLIMPVLLNTHTTS